MYGSRELAHVIDHMIHVYAIGHTILLWIYQEPKLSFEDARKMCVKTIVNSADFSCIQLVYGFAGKHSIFSNDVT
jgi:hypothetical protein